MGGLNNPPLQGSGSNFDADLIDGLSSEDFALAVTAEDEFTASAAQTIFTLSQTFQPNGLSVFSVNGVSYAEGTDYNIGGTTATWLNNDFIMEAGDKIVVKYQRL